MACAASACPARCAAVWEAAPVHVPASAIVVVGEFANEADRSPAEPDAELPAHAHRWWELRLRVSNPTTDPVAVFWTDSYLVLPAGRAVPLLSLTVGSLPSSVPPRSSIETRFRFEATFPPRPPSACRSSGGGAAKPSPRSGRGGSSVAVQRSTPYPLSRERTSCRGGGSWSGASSPWV